MTQAISGHEHEFEPEFGLPEALPSGERILWQGAPDFRAMAVQVFHLRKLALYFLLLLLLRASYLYSTGLTPLELLPAMIWPLALALVGFGAVASLAWLTVKTTAYTLTDRRVVMRIGIVLTLSFNLPLGRIETADLRLDRQGCGDIPLRLSQGDKIAWLHLWPHVRPWRVSQPEPTLRCIPDARKVAGLLAKAWAELTNNPPPNSLPVASAQGDGRPQWQASLT